MDIRKGLFRLWIVASLLWLVGASMYAWGDRKRCIESCSTLTTGSCDCGSNGEIFLFVLGILVLPILIYGLGRLIAWLFDGFFLPGQLVTWDAAMLGLGLIIGLSLYGLLRPPIGRYTIKKCDELGGAKEDICMVDTATGNVFATTNAAAGRPYFGRPLTWISAIRNSW